jgi:hypothetical protein
MPGGRIARDVGIQGLALAQVAAQHGIDQSGGAHGIGSLGGLHGRVHHGVMRRLLILEFVQGHGQQSTYQEIQ